MKIISAAFALFAVIMIGLLIGFIILPEIAVAFAKLF